MDFKFFKAKRSEYVEWMTANGFNEGDCDKNGEFSVIETFSPYFDFFIDIGANKGIFINRLNAALSKYVLAFEPNPHLKCDLSEKISRGILVQKALSNKKGCAKFNIYVADDTTSSLLERADMMPHFTSKVECIDVELDILDSYTPLIEREASKGIFIKIDAEGVEFPILQGARAVLEKPSAIFLMFEYSKAWKLGGHTLKEAFHLLDTLDFKMYRVTPFGLESLRFYTPDMDGPDYCNYFAAKGAAIGEMLSVESIRSATHNVNDFYLFPL
jgi:FkbM family methyltransferase